MTEALAMVAAPLRLVHALAGVLLVVGVLGRWVLLEHAESAARAADVPALRALLRASGVFERMVIGSSMVVLLLGLLTAWAYGYPLLGSLQGGSVNWVFAALVLFLGMLVLVPLVFLPKGRIFAAALDETEARGHVTPALLAAFGDPVTRAAHVAEIAVVAVVLVLMISKPF